MFGFSANYLQLLITKESPWVRHRRFLGGVSREAERHGQVVISSRVLRPCADDCGAVCETTTKKVAHDDSLTLRYKNHLRQQGVNGEGCLEQACKSFRGQLIIDSDTKSDLLAPFTTTKTENIPNNRV